MISESAISLGIHNYHEIHINVVQQTSQGKSEIRSKKTFFFRFLLQTVFSEGCEMLLVDVHKFE